jgi:hypothetical protein
MIFAWGAYLKTQQRRSDELKVCACYCHPGPMAERPPRWEDSYYCETCNEERSLPFMELLEI